MEDFDVTVAMESLHNTIYSLLDAIDGISRQMYDDDGRMNDYYDAYLELNKIYGMACSDYSARFGHDWHSYHTEVRKIRYPERITAEEIAR